MILDEFGANVKKIRTQKGWTISYGAREAKIKWEQLNALETGKGKPTVECIYKIAEGWKVPITRFFKFARGK